MTSSRETSSKVVTQHSVLVFISTCKNVMHVDSQAESLLIPVVDILRVDGILLDDLSKLSEMIGNSYRIE